jgi:hypothetical protein
MPRKRITGRYVLPEVVNPPDRICFRVEVPNERYHIAAFMGQLYALASAASWQNDESHTALDVAKVWWGVFNTLHLCNDVPINSGADEGIELMIRQNPSNPCLLETSINGTDWCVFADLSLCVAGSSQPGSGSPQPPPNGGSQCYNARLTASGKWLLPFQVTTGDLITISDVSGAAADGSGRWYCPNGQNYFLGACSGAISTNSGDPLNTVGHMRLIASIGSVYYDAYNASITVPAGVTGANVEFQVNDPSLSDNFGEFTFKACVTNNSAGNWTHIFDFATNDYGWIPETVTVGTPGLWVASSGWQAQHIQSPSANYYNMAWIKKTIGSRTLTSFEILYDVSGHATNQSTTNDAVVLWAGATQLKVVSFASLVDGNGQTLRWDGVQAGVTIPRVSLASSYYVPGATYAGTATIRKITISGTGTDPF